MTSPTDPRVRERINPSKTIHNPPPEIPSIRRLTTKQVGVIGTVIVDLILAQVALALGGINILGVKPFAFLTTWGQEIQVRAADAYNKAMASEAVANSSDATSAVALGQVAVTKDQVQQNQVGLQTTWNGLWEASNNTTLSPGQNKTAQDVKNGQIAVRQIAVQGATGASGANANVQLTWNNIYNGAFNTSVSTATLQNVYDTNRTIVIRTGTGETNQGVLGGNIQSTWDSIYVAAGGTGPSTNRSLTDAQQRLNLLNQTAYGASGNIYATWDQYYRNWYGWAPPTIEDEDFGAATEEIKESITDLIDRVDALETEKDAGAFSGNSIAVNFKDYSVGALPNPPWTVNYPTISGGFGSNTLTVTDKRQVQFTESGNVKRRGVAIHNTTQLTTDYHKVSVGLSGWPQIGASNWIYARSNNTGSTAIAARIYVNTFLFFFNTSFTVELYSITNNSAELIASGTTALGNAAATWTLECGTTNDTNGLNTYRVLCDGKQVISQTVTGKANGGKYVGFGLESTNVVGNFFPAPVTSFSAYDNTPATFLGVTFKASRATTAAYQVNSAPNGAVLPADALTSQDIPPDKTLTKLANNEIQVSVEGWYAVNVTLSISNSLNIRPAVFVNDTIYATGIWANPASNTFLVYAKKNDRIQPGYHNGASFTLSLIGDGAGLTTNWSMTFIGNTIPTNPTK